MMNDLPQMTSLVGYSGQTYGGGMLSEGIDLTPAQPTLLQRYEAAKEAFRQQQEQFFPAAFAQQTEPNETMNTKRIVRVFIADPDSRVAVEESLLHKTEEKVTDLTDQELFYELPIKEVLDKHNAKRLTIIDKQASAKAGKDIYLEAIKIRDLKMTVVVVATF